MPADLKEKYFEYNGKEWRAAPFLHEKIMWRQANLLERSDIEALAACSVIFCRNAFIYFSFDAIRKVVDTFAEKMSVPAFLFVGAAESLLKVTDDFDLEEIGDCFAYVKRK